MKQPINVKWHSYHPGDVSPFLKKEINVEYTQMSTNFIIKPKVKNKF